MLVSDCPDAPKLDPRVRRTRKLLEDAMRSLMAERSYADISVGDIAERATVNRATFYAHFEDKNHLATSMLRGEMEEALLARLQHRAPLTTEMCVEVAVGVFEFMARIKRTCPRKPDELTVTFGATLQAAIQEFFRKWLTYEPASMRWFPGSTPESVSTVLSWSIYGGAVRWSGLAKRGPVREAAEQIVRLVIQPADSKAA